jgi:hypothetical protein
MSSDLKMSGKGVDWTRTYLTLLKQRNKVEVEPFKDVYDACAAVRRENRELMQSNAEVRAHVGVLLHDFQDHFQGVEEAGFADQYQVIRSRLLSLNEQFSSRLNKSI